MQDRVSASAPAAIFIVPSAGKGQRLFRATLLATAFITAGTAICLVTRHRSAPTQPASPPVFTPPNTATTYGALPDASAFAAKAASILLRDAEPTLITLPLSAIHTPAPETVPASQVAAKPAVSEVVSLPTLSAKSGRQEAHFEPRPATRTAGDPHNAAAKKPARIAGETAATTAAITEPPSGLFDAIGSFFKGPSTALAYADMPSLTAGATNYIRSGRGGVALYDIEAHTVTLPNGVKLEAHSGQSGQFGSQYVNMMDDSRYAPVRMHGPTPSSPQGVTYKLTLREALFHNVQALRLTPVSGPSYGRTGLLAHTYMLGPDGNSNGCVSFRDYKAFLTAFQRGEIDRIVVVGKYAPAAPDTPTPREHHRRFALNRS